MVKSRKRKRNRIKMLILFCLYKTFFKQDDIVLKVLFVLLITILIITINVLLEQGVFCCVLLAYF